MADIKQLLEERKKAKKHKPNFVVKESHNKRKIEVKWRFPDGRHSGVRQEHKGKPALVTIGYRTNKLVRGLHSSGLRPVVINNEKELLSLNKDQGAILSSRIGAKKRLAIIEAAVKNKIAVLNVKDLAKLKENISNDLISRKKEKAERVKQRSKKEEDKKKIVEKKKKEEEKKKEDSKKSPNAEENKLEESLNAEVQHEQEKKEMEKQEAEKTIIKKQ